MLKRRNVHWTRNSLELKQTQMDEVKHRISREDVPGRESCGVMLDPVSRAVIIATVGHAIENKWAQAASLVWACLRVAQISLAAQGWGTGLWVMQGLFFGDFLNTIDSTKANNLPNLLTSRPKGGLRHPGDITTAGIGSALPCNSGLADAPSARLNTRPWT